MKVTYQEATAAIQEAQYRLKTLSSKFWIYKYPKLKAYFFFSLVLSLFLFLRQGLFIWPLLSRNLLCRLALNSRRSICLWFLSAGIKGCTRMPGPKSVCKTVSTNLTVKQSTSKFINIQFLGSGTPYPKTATRVTGQE